MYPQFAAFIKTALGSEEQKEFAARLGISSSQLSKILQGQAIERATLAKIITGISEKPKVRAECLASFLRDWTSLAGDDAARVRVTVR